MNLNTSRSISKVWDQLDEPVDRVAGAVPGSMLRSMKVVFVIIGMMMVSSCSGTSIMTPESVSAYSPPNRSVCDRVLQLPRGFLCAIRPSRIDPAARDSLGNVGPDARFGFGYHVVAFPNRAINPTHVHVHLGGSGGRPFNPNSSEFGARTFLEESFTSGFMVIQPAYHNRYPINSADECQGNPGVDNCAGRVREEKILGTDLSNVVDVPLADSIAQRLIKIVSYLKNSGFEFPVEFTTNSSVDWTKLNIGGHSQGSGHALYIGKTLGAHHVCIIGGIHDVPDNIPPVPVRNIADWLLDPGFVISKTRITGFLTQEDENYEKFSRTLNFLGIRFSEVSSPPYADWDGSRVNGHAGSIKDPRFSAQRAKACFYSSYGSEGKATVK